MDIETKEAVLKLAGYEITQHGGGKTPSGTFYRVGDLAIGTTRTAAILYAYNTFLTRQNDMS